jgi:F-type H+-transporting ATPase subunit epsilon
MFSSLQCIVVTPERTVVDERAEFVALPLFDGEIGIAPGHSPMIGRLGFGELRIRGGEDLSRFYVEGGFVEVLGEVVSVLTNRAVPAKELDADVAEEQLGSTQRRPAHADEEFAERDRLTGQLRAQIRVARRTENAS